MAGLVEMSEADTKKQIIDASKKTPYGDTFRIRVRRKRPGTMTGSDIIASFDEGSTDHIMFPEKWLPELAGGGNYTLEVFHMSEPMAQIGDGVSFIVDGTPRNVDLDLLLKPEWGGPRNCTHPKRPKQVNGTTVLHAVGNEIGVDLQPRMSTPFQPQPNGTSVDTGFGAIMAERAQRLDVELRETRKNAEIEMIRREAAERIKDAESNLAQIRAELRDLKMGISSAPKTSVTDDLSKLIPALVPIAQTILAGQNDMRIKQTEMAAKAAEAQLQASKEANERMDRLLNMMANKPSIDPVILTLIQEMFKKDSSNPMLTDIITAMSTMSQSTLAVLTAATDAGIINRESDGGWQQILGTAVQAAGNFFDMLAAKHGGGSAVSQGQGQGQGQGRFAQPQSALPQGQPQQPQPSPAVLQQLDTMIKNHADPAQAAAVFFDAITSDPLVRQRFTACGNDTDKFFEVHWRRWVESNMQVHGPYVLALRDAVIREGVRRQLMPESALVQIQTARAQTVEAPQAQPVVVNPPEGEGKDEDDEGEEKEGQAPFAKA